MSMLILDLIVIFGLICYLMHTKVTKHKLKYKKLSKLAQIIPLVDIQISNSETSEIKLITWYKDLSIPVGYGASANPFITIVTGVPVGEVLKYHLPREHNKRISNPAHNAVIVVNTTGKLQLNSQMNSISININEAYNYRCSKLAKALINEKTAIHETIIQLKHDYYNSEQEQEYIQYLALINKELDYYKKEFPEYLI